MITPAQCKAARALLGWTQHDLARRSQVSQRAIALFETGATTPFPRTLRDIKAELENGGILFIEPEEGVGGQGVRLVWGVEPGLRQDSGDDDEAAAQGKRTRQALPNDPDLRGLYDYWRERRDEWQELSASSRRAVLREIFGDLPDGDPIVDWVETGENDTFARPMS